MRWKYGKENAEMLQANCGTSSGTPRQKRRRGCDEWYRIKGEVEWNPNVTAEELNNFLSLRTYYDDYLASIAWR